MRILLELKSAKVMAAVVSHPCAQPSVPEAGRPAAAAIAIANWTVKDIMRKWPLS